MLAGPGRPSKACNRCKTQKARCSGDKPICTRCSSLRRSCNYSREITEMPKISRPPQVTGPAAHPSQQTSTTPPNSGHSFRHHPALVGTQSSYPLSMPFTSPGEGRYHGIPLSLVLDLVDVYYTYVGNASLVLHKKSFLEEIVAGNACPSVVISVCAVASNFYQDKNNEATLKEHGFMTEWAERAGKLVFQEAENVSENNLVTFWNLSFFWHSQGSWRRSYIHRGNSAQAAHVLGLGFERPGTEDSWTLESRRRRFWACYLLHCYASEPFPQPEPGGNIQEVTLPWREEEYDIGVSRHPRVSLASGQSNGGIYCEFVKAWTLWSAVNALIRSPESKNGGVTAVHLLDDRISDWWSKLPSSLHLTPSRITEVPHDILPNLLHLHIIYHQCLCALHSSIVPLFCWSIGDDTRSSARQVSAQVAFENACAASALICAVLPTLPNLGAIPSFVAYAAYCGCAIQIPFMWCSKSTVQQRARANVRANIKMINALAKYWKFCSILEIRVHCLLRIYERSPILIEDEPRYIDPRRLTSFKINAPRARESILGHIRTLWTNGDGYAKPGDENADLEIEEEWPSQAAAPAMNNQEDPTVGQPQTQARSPLSSLPPLTLPQAEEQWQQSSPIMHQGYTINEEQNVAAFYPWSEAVMLDMFPSNEDFSSSEFDVIGTVDSHWLGRGM